MSSRIARGLLPALSALAWSGCLCAPAQPAAAAQQPLPAQAPERLDAGIVLDAGPVPDAGLPAGDRDGGDGGDDDKDGVGR